MRSIGDALDRLLPEQGFDRFVKRLCEPYYAEVMGRPGLAPGVYFRCLLIGYFVEISSERGSGRRVRPLQRDAANSSNGPSLTSSIPEGCAESMSGVMTTF